MKLYSKKVYKTFVEIDGEEFLWTEVMEVLEGLTETDGYFEFIIVENDDLSRVLEARDVLTRNARGAQTQSRNLRSFTEELRALGVMVES